MNKRKSKHKKNQHTRIEAKSQQGEPVSKGINQKKQDPRDLRRIVLFNEHLNSHEIYTENKCSKSACRGNLHNKTKGILHPRHGCMRIYVDEH